jgi:hypothetical protein
MEVTGAMTHGGNRIWPTGNYTLGGNRLGMCATNVHKRLKFATLRSCDTLQNGNSWEEGRARGEKESNKKKDRAKEQGKSEAATRKGSYEKDLLIRLS